ncbi:MAG: hypothetical protein ACT4PV_16305 [Planctomycetaceae bacterium]
MAGQKRKIAGLGLLAFVSLRCGGDETPAAGGTATPEALLRVWRAALFDGDREAVAALIQAEPGRETTVAYWEEVAEEIGLWNSMKSEISSKFGAEAWGRQEPGGSSLAFLYAARTHPIQACDEMLAAGVERRGDTAVATAFVKTIWPMVRLPEGWRFRCAESFAATAEAVAERRSFNAKWRAWKGKLAVCATLDEFWKAGD